MLDCTISCFTGIENIKDKTENKKDTADKISSFLTGWSYIWMCPTFRNGVGIITPVNRKSFLQLESAENQIKHCLIKTAKMTKAIVMRITSFLRGFITNLYHVFAHNLAKKPLVFIRISSNKM